MSASDWTGKATAPARLVRMIRAWHGIQVLFTQPFRGSVRLTEAAGEKPDSEKATATPYPFQVPRSESTPYPRGTHG
jgi:hypothetical protein